MAESPVCTCGHFAESHQLRRATRDWGECFHQGCICRAYRYAHRRPTETTYVCSEPGCEAVFSDPEPDEAWAQYTEHQNSHDFDNDYITTAEVPD